MLLDISGTCAKAAKAKSRVTVIGTFGLAVGAAWAFSLGIAGQVLTFLTRAWLSFAPSTCGCRSVSITTSTELIPKVGSTLGFDIT
jgi:hypothetical protein